MKNLSLLVISFLSLCVFAFTNVTNVEAQQCRGSVTCCPAGRYEEVCQTSSGGSCTKGQSGCVCQYECSEPLTHSCRVENGHCGIRVPDSQCNYEISGSCYWSGGGGGSTSTPSPTPGGGGGGGSCAWCTNQSQCAASGGSWGGTSSYCSVAGDGCCNVSSGGGGGGGGGGYSVSCDLDWTDSLGNPITIAVGETIQLRNYFDKGQGQLHQQHVRVSGPSNTVSVSRGDVTDPNDSSNKTINLNITGLNPGTVVVRIEGEAQYRTNCSEPHIDPTDCNRRDACDSTRRTIIVEESPWVQVNDGNLITNGPVINPVHTSSFLMGNVNNDPGVVFFNGSLNTSPGRISTPNWNTNNGGTPIIESYNQLRDRVPQGVTPTPLGEDLAAALYFGGATADGFSWYEATGDVALDVNTTIPPNRKVIVFVPGNVRINGSLRIQDPESSFVMIVAQGNIIVSPVVGNGISPDSTVPHLEGIFYAGGQFITQSGSNRLNVRGTVVANGGVSLSRNTETVNPSETFTFAPEYILNFPQSLRSTRAFWREVAP